MPPVAGQPPGDIRDLRVAPDGTLWLVTSEGVGSLRDGEWTTHPNLGALLLGFDGLGRTWLADEEGDSVSAWDGQTWTTYGPDEGWASTGRLYRAVAYGNVSENVVTDSRGLVWLATSSDVRVFDGQRWDLFGPEDLGFVRSEDMTREGYDFSLTEVALDGSGNVWVGDCAWMGPGPRGQGARWFDGQAWQGQDSPEVGSGCVEDIEVDDAGRVWIGVDGELYRHTPGEGWVTFPHPESPPVGDRRWGWIADVELTWGESVWVAMSPCGGASCDTGVIFTFLVGDDGWTLFSEKGPGDFALTQDGDGWLCIADEFYEVTFDQVDLVGQNSSFGCAVELDPTGRVWLAVRGQPTLRVFDPAGGN